MALLSQWQRDLIIENFDKLTDNIEMEHGLLTQLICRGVINVRQENAFQNAIRYVSPRNGTAKLLEFLLKQSQEQFDNFCQCLIDTNQTHVVKSYLTSGNQHNVHHEEKRQKKTERELEEPGLLQIDIPIVTALEVENKHKELARCYDFGKKPRGRCVIINNRKFYKLSYRKGSDTDATNLKNLFTKLHFEVDTWTDMTDEEARDKILEESKNPAHKKADAFVFIVLSHGSLGHIHAVNSSQEDPKKLSIEDDIVKSFSGKNCPALAGKPKIFLIQACQGSSTTRGVPEADDAGPETVEGSPVEHDAETVISENLVHEMGDVVIAYSSLPGFVSWRTEELGSWFMREFVITCSEAAHKCHLQDILTAVARKVSEKQANFEGFKQLTSTVTRITKNIYFFPGYFKP